MTFDSVRPLLGIALLIALAWACSENRRAFSFAMAARALALQAAIALFLTRLPAARDALMGLNGVVTALMDATHAGTAFVFGYVGGGAPPFAVANPAGLTSFAFGVLPLVIVISALSALLWHWRILPLVVGAIAWCLKKTMGLGGAVGLASGATIFLGMVEAPLLVRPCLARMTRTELFILFTVGLASVAGTMFVLYSAPR